MQLGLSAQAISGYGSHHPWDPSDLLRCMNYCTSHGIDTLALQKRMAGRSTEWDRLLPEWDHIVGLLLHEMDTSTNGKAPVTYKAMERIIADGTACEPCDSTGRGAECQKCKGSGYRTSGRCRARQCYGGADVCQSCRGDGYTTKGVIK